MPNINRTAGITCATTISAQKPRKTHTKIPLLSSRAPEAANAVTGAMIPIIVVSAFMTSSLYFVVVKRFDCLCFHICIAGAKLIGTSITHPNIPI
jgi:hypothetical protein